MTPATATAVQAPAQPTLAGVAPASAEATARFALMGSLQRDALCFQTPAHQPCVQALVGQHIEHHPQAHHILVTRLFEASPNGQADATELAARLYAGTPVLVLGTGLEPDTWHGQPVLRLIHCQGITRQAPAPTTPRGDH